MSYEKELKVAKNVAKKAGKILMKYFGKVGYEIKKDNSRVTKADLESEKLILKTIRKNFPEHTIYSEEAGIDQKKSDYMWVIDPLDGTTNFSLGNPFFNVSIGFVKKDEPILGVIYYPILKELYYAVKGEGAYTNGKKINVSNKKDIKKIILGYCHSRGEEPVKRIIKIFDKIKPKCPYFRKFGSAALELAYVGIGRIDGFLMVNMNPYDVAAGAVIAKEAGAKVTDLKGKSFTLKSKDIFAANKSIHEQILKILK